MLADSRQCSQYLTPDYVIFENYYYFIELGTLLHFTLLRSFACFVICIFRSPFGIVGSAYSQFFHRCVHCSLSFPLFKVYLIKVLWNQKTLASKHEIRNSINSWMKYFMIINRKMHAYTSTRTFYLISVPS